MTVWAVYHEESYVGSFLQELWDSEEGAASGMLALSVGEYATDEGEWIKDDEGLILKREVGGGDRLFIDPIDVRSLPDGWRPVLSVQEREPS